MAELKTKPTDESVEVYLNSIEKDTQRKDSFAILNMIRDVSKTEPVMWGSSIIGFGTYKYRYASGREAEWMKIGFAPRKRNLTLYIMDGFDQYDSLLSKLGKFRTGKACLYINKLEDVDLDVLREMVERSVDHVTRSSLE
jgi:hypothetical protein